MPFDAAQGPQPQPPPPPGLDPGAELQHFLEMTARSVETLRRAVEDAHGSLERIRSTAGGPGSGPVVEPVRPDLAAPLISRLLREVPGGLRNYFMIMDEGPAYDETTMRDNQERIRAGDPQWSIYPAKILESPSGRQWVQAWAGVGEVQRVVPDTQTEFAVFGDEVVVALARWGDPASGYAIARHPLVVAAFQAFFDAVWATAHTVPSAAAHVTDPERLVQLLGMGLKDESIARVMGIGLRTVRRRVAALMAVHGVDTRFQLGAALALAPPPAASSPPWLRPPAP